MADAGPPSEEAHTNAYSLSYDRALACKTAGNELLKAGEPLKALKKYHFGHLETKSSLAKSGMGATMPEMQGIVGAASMDGESMPAGLKPEIEQLHCTLLNNMAVCLMKREKWDRVIAVTSDCLKIQPQNFKALMRRCKAYLQLGKKTLCERDLVAGLALNPKDPDLVRIQAELAADEAAYKKKEAKRMKGMFDKL